MRLIDSDYHTARTPPPPLHELANDPPDLINPGLLWCLAPCYSAARTILLKRSLVDIIIVMEIHKFIYLYNMYIFFIVILYN